MPVGTALIPAALMILLFLRDWRSALVVVLNIPLALMAAVLALWLTGQTINIDGINYRWGMPIVEKDPDGSNTFKLMGQGLGDFQFGLTNNFTYGPFNAYMLFNGQVGGKNYNYNKVIYYFEGVHGDVDQAGKPDYRKKPLIYYNGGSSGPGQPFSTASRKRCSEPTPGLPP